MKYDGKKYIAIAGKELNTVRIIKKKKGKTSGNKPLLSLTETIKQEFYPQLIKIIPLLKDCDQNHHLLLIVIYQKSHQRVLCLLILCFRFLEAFFPRGTWHHKLLNHNFNLKDFSGQQT